MGITSSSTSLLVSVFSLFIGYFIIHNAKYLCESPEVIYEFSSNYSFYFLKNFIFILGRNIPTPSRVRFGPNPFGWYFRKPVGLVEIVMFKKLQLTLSFPALILLSINRAF